MSNHTPGPWTYTTSNDGWSFDIYQADDASYTPESSDVATLYVRTVKCDPKEVQEANARIIAAAPELLDAAKHALRALRSNPDSPMTGSECLLSFAVVKALGETNED